VTRFRITGALLIALVTAGLCSAQPPASRGDWASLKTLTAGAQIQITMTDRPKAVRGRFQSVTDDGLVVTTPAGQEMLTRPLVAKVSVQKNNHRIRNSLLGLAIGAGGGLAAGAAIDAADQCSGGLGKCGLQIVGPNAGKEVLTPVGAFIGLAIGALLHTGGWRVVY
jgi:hypothetical protein